MHVFRHLCDSWETPVVEAALAITEVANAAPDVPLSQEDAFRLVEQTTFGAQLDDINLVSQIGPETWINQQMQLPATNLEVRYGPLFDEKNSCVR